MGSLSACLKQVGKAVSKEDRDTIIARSAVLRDGGMVKAEADLQATRELFGRLRDEFKGMEATAADPVGAPAPAAAELPLELPPGDYRPSGTFEFDGRTWRIRSVLHTGAGLEASTVFDGKPARTEKFAIGQDSAAQQEAEQAAAKKAEEEAAQQRKAAIEARRTERETERRVFREFVKNPDMVGLPLEKVRLFAEARLPDMPAPRRDILARAIHKELAEKAVELAKQKNRDPAVKAAAVSAAIADKFPDGLQPDHAAAVHAGFDHALAGKTKSTLSGEFLLRMNIGYDAAQAWMKTEEGAAWYEGRPVNKLQNTGLDLRRWYEQMREQMKAGESDIKKAWKQIDRATNRADLFAPLLPDGVTPGFRLYVTEVRDQVRPFKAWLDDSYRWDGSIHSKYDGDDKSNIDLMLEGRRYPDTYQHNGKTITQEEADSFSSDEAYRAQWLRERAREYIEQVRGITSVIEGASSVAEAAQKWHERFIQTFSDKRWNLDSSMLTPGGQALVSSRNGIDAWTGETSDVMGLSHQSAWTKNLIDNEKTVALPDRATPLVPPRLDRVSRDGGTDYRKGENVTPEQFKATFGMADVGFGTWVGAKEDQDHLNYSFDALSDLAKHFGTDAKNLGFGGAMHFTIGALGHGKHAAHFSPNQPSPIGPVQVINVTNTKGDGTVYHEWAHALDHFMGGQWKSLVRRRLLEILQHGVLTPEQVEARARQFLTGGWYFKGDKNGDKVGAALRGFGRWDRPQSAYKTNADQLGKDYWGNEKELIARAAEAWAYDTLPHASTYLVNAWVADGKVTQAAGYRGTPYPTGQERKEFNLVMGALAKATKWENGRPTVSLDAFNAALPDEVKAGERRMAELGKREAMQAYYDRLLAEKADKAAADAQAKADAAAAEQQRLDELAEQKLKDLQPPPVVDAPPPSSAQGPLSDQELSDLFDQAAAEVREESQEKPEEPPPGEPEEDRDRWTAEDWAAIHRLLAKGTPVLLAEDGHGIPTIHEFGRTGQTDMVGYGVFKTVGDGWTASWEGGSAMDRTPSGKAYTTVQFTGGAVPAAAYNLQAAADAALANRRAAETPAAGQKQAPAVIANFKTARELDAWLAQEVGDQYQLARETPKGKLKDQGVKLLVLDPGKQVFNGPTSTSGATTVGADVSLVYHLIDGRLVWWDHKTGNVNTVDPADPRLEANPDYDEFVPSPAGADTEGTILPEWAVRIVSQHDKVDFRFEGDQFVALFDGQEVGRMEAAAARKGGFMSRAFLENAILDAVLKSLGVDRVSADAGTVDNGPAQRAKKEAEDDRRHRARTALRDALEKARAAGATQVVGTIQSMISGVGHGVGPKQAFEYAENVDRAIQRELDKKESEQADKTARDLIAEAAKLGVKGADQALAGLAKLFGSKAGRLNSFPAGFDEEAYNEAKPLFKDALKSFQEAGKTLKDLFKLLIQQLGDGIKPYAMQFAKDEALGNNLEQQAAAAPAGSPSIALARDIERYLLHTAAPMDWRTLFNMADRHFGGTQAEGKYTPKDAYDALEAAINLRILRSPSLFSPAVTEEDAQLAVGTLTRLLEKVPTQTKRTAEQDRLQQFSTVPPLAFVANWVANVRPTDVMLEPSAGLGGLAVFSRLAGARVVLNEWNARRADLLQQVMPDARVFREDAQYLHNILPDDVRPTVVIMNPPFSNSIGGVKDTMVGAQHVEQALERLPQGGRLVAIVGEGMAMDKPAFRDWWKKIGAKYDVRAAVPMDGSGYAKYGTTFDNVILVIDKVAPSGRKPVTTKMTDYTDLVHLLAEVRNGRPEHELPVTDHSAEPDPRGGTGDAAAAGDAPAADTGPAGPGGAAGVGTGQPGGKTGVGRGGSSGGRSGRGSKSRGDAGRDPAGGADAGTNADGSGQADAAAGGRPDSTGDQSGVPVGSNTAVAGEMTDSVFEGYQPQRLQIPGAKPHPGPLVQSSAMASVLPPAPTYTPNLPKETIEKGLVSIAQIEAVVYAGQSHQQLLETKVGDTEARDYGLKAGTPYRRGFFIGDGTGVGKGREIGAILLDNIRQGRKKHVWVSEKQGLMNDAARDFAGIQDGVTAESVLKSKGIFNLGDTKAAGSVSQAEGVLFTTYATLRSEAKDKEPGGFKKGDEVQVGRAFGPPGSPDFDNTKLVKIDKKKNTVTVEWAGGRVIEHPFAQILSIAGDSAWTNTLRDGARKPKTRVDQIVEWLGPDFDGVIAFDEAHNAGNAVPIKGSRGDSEPSAQALAVVELQRRLPGARVVYVSATGATEVSNLSFANRLGIWGPSTPFASVNEFISQMTAGGLATMELVARDLKQTGAYMARSLSYDGVNYSRIDHELNPLQHDIYNRLTDAWQVVLNNIEEALKAIGAVTDSGKVKNSKAKSNAMSAFWGAQQRFFNQIITSMQMPSVIDAVEADIARGDAVVLQLVNTNEAQQERALAKRQEEGEESDLEDLDLTPRDQLIDMVRKSFPVQQFQDVIGDDGKRTTVPLTDSNGDPVLNKAAVAMRDKLIEDLQQISVPDGPLEILVNHFGPEIVAEVTGRKQRVVAGRWNKNHRGDGEPKAFTDKRGPASARADADAFMADKKRVLIFSDAGGTGFSFHADLKKVNQRKRQHYLVQPGWRANKAVQGLGRTHRTNQKSAPHYKLVATNIPAHKRFLSSIARRLDQLGALTKGQRDTSSGGLFSEKDNLESKYAERAVRAFLFDAKAGQIEGLDFNDLLQQLGLKDMVNKDTNQITESKIPEVRQFLNRLLSLKLETQELVFHGFISRMEEIIEQAAERGELDTGMQTIRALESRVTHEEIVFTEERTGAETSYVELELTHPTRMHSFPEEKAQGAKIEWIVNAQSGRVWGRVRSGNQTLKNGAVVERYRMLGTGGMAFRTEEDFRNKAAWKTITEDEARLKWDQETAKKPPTYTTKTHMIVGAMLPIWDRLKTEGTMQVARTQTSDGRRLLGRVIHESDVAELRKRLNIAAPESKLPPADVLARVLKGETAELANGWKLERARVSDDLRVEIKGLPSNVGPALRRELLDAGVIEERIQWNTRYFMPVNKPEVLGAVIKSRPVVGLAKPADQPKLKQGLAGAGVPVDELRSLVAKVAANWSGVDAYVVPTIDDLPANIRASLFNQGALGDVRGLMVPNGSVYLIANRMPSLDEAQGILFHEVYGHVGMRAFLGDEYAAQMQLLRMANPTLAAEANAWYANYSRGHIGARVQRGMSRLDAEAEVRLLAVEEALADRAGNAPPPSGWKALMAKLQQALRRLGLGWVADKLESMTEAETHALLMNARRAVTRTGGPMHVLAGMPAGLQDPANSAVAPIWTSALLAEVSKAPMKAGDATAWTQYLDAMVKRGAVKADEIEWTGLREWLALQADGAKGAAAVEAAEGADSPFTQLWKSTNPAKITREAVAQYLSSNGVLVKDVVLRDARTLVSDLNEKFVDYGYSVDYDNIDDEAVFYNEDGDLVDFIDLPAELQDLVDRHSDATVFGRTRYGQYTLPGGTNYREVLLTLPAKDTITTKRVAAPNGWGDTDGGNVGIERTGDTRADYRSGHWDQANVLAHIRLNDRMADRPGVDLNEIGERIRQAIDTREQAFRQWFGDSQITYPDGKPRVMYHGTGADIYEFRGKQAGAIFVTPEPIVAQAYAGSSVNWLDRNGMVGGQSVMPLYVRAEDPFDFENADHVDALVDRAFERINTYTQGDGEQALLDGEEQTLYTRDVLRYALTEGQWSLIENPEIQAAIKSLGHDGFYVSEDGFKNLAVYQANQLKSAIGNRGTYDLGSDNILLSQPPVDPVLESAKRKAGLRGPRTLGDKVRAFYGRALESVRSREVIGQTLRQEVLDQFYGILRAERAELGALPAEQSLYVTARLANGGTSSVMRGLMLHGQARWGSTQQHLEKVPDSKGLLDILKPLGNDMNDWFGWMVGNRAARLLTEGRENNLTADEIKALQGLADTPDKEILFRRVSLEYAAFKRSVLDVAQEAGLINPESRRVWDHADYIPFYREIDEKSLFSPTGKKGLAGQSSGIRQLKGGESELNDPMENLLMNFSRLIDASLKNNAIKQTIEALGETDLVQKVGYSMTPAIIPRKQIVEELVRAGTPESIIATLPDEVFEGMAKMWAIQAPTDPDVVRIMVGGKPQFYRVNDRLLLKALTSFVPFDFPGLELARGAKRLLTSMVTSTPEFMIRNWVRDSMAAQAITQTPFNPLESVKGIRRAYKESGGYEAMLFAGASFQSGHVNAGDPGGTAVHMRRALRERGFRAAASEAGAWQATKDWTARRWESYRQIGEAIENANREAVYEAAVKAGKSATEAAYEAKDLMDFSLRGSAAAYQLLADVLPFFNARVQGLYRLGRADRARLMKMGAIMITATALLALANGGEDWYEQLPDWDKDTYWHFKIGGAHFRVPKPFEIGVLFATLPERIGRGLLGLDSGKKTLNRVWANVRDQLAFDPMPQLVRPVVDAWANKDTFRDRPIEGMADEGMRPHARSDARTSDTMRVLAESAAPVADWLELGPKKMEFLVNGYLGTVGMYALSVSDAVIRTLEGKPDRPAVRADDLPIIRTFYQEDPARATVFESDVYKMRKEVEAVMREVMTAAKSADPGKQQKARDLMAEEADKIKVRGLVSGAAQGLSVLNQQISKVYSDPKMTPDEKRAKVDALQQKKNDIARKAATDPKVREAF